MQAFYTERGEYANAVLLYGEPRLTRDIDITLGVDVDRLADLAALADQLVQKGELPPD